MYKITTTTTSDTREWLFDTRPDPGVFLSQHYDLSILGIAALQISMSARSSLASLILLVHTQGVGRAFQRSAASGFWRGLDQVTKTGNFRGYTQKRLLVAWHVITWSLRDERCCLVGCEAWLWALLEA